MGGLIESVASESDFKRLDGELPQLRAELESCAREDPAHGLELAAAVYRFWVARGMLDEGRGWLTRLLGLAPVGVRDATRAKALCGAGTLAFLQGDAAEARRCQSESVAIARELGDRALEADALIGLARVAILKRDPAAMEQDARAALAAATAAGDEARAATALHHLAESLRRQDRYEEALPVYREAIEHHRALGDRRSVALELHNLGSVARLTGDAEGAAELFRQSLGTAAELGHDRLVGYCLLGLAQIDAGRGSFSRAARLVAASDARFAAVGAALDPEYGDLRDSTRRASEHALGSVAFARDTEAGAALQPNAAVEEALRD